MSKHGAHVRVRYPRSHYHGQTGRLWGMRAAAGPYRDSVLVILDSTGERIYIDLSYLDILT